MFEFMKLENPTATPAGTRRHRAAATVSALLLLSSLACPADEGMWLYSAPPRRRLAEKYQFEPSDAWLEHLRLSSVRFNTGGSAEFVSEDGLLLSNHHVGRGSLQRLSSKEHDYLRDGFYARTLAEEKKCEGVELVVLVSIEDVTARVNAAVPADLPVEKATAARRAVLAGIEKESLEKTGLRSDVVTLYQGGQYHLYRYRRYTDVRLVFAPEQQIAFFGGDPDNFEYPRFNLDICLFRAYENGQPARIQHYLKWSPAGPAEGELVFVSGHPGRTGRLLTVTELEFTRDVRLPDRLARLKQIEVLLASWSERSAENARRAQGELFGVQNGRKVFDGELAGLLDPKLLAGKRQAEDQLRAFAAGDPRFATNAWDRIAAAQRRIAANWTRHGLLEGAEGFRSSLFGTARTLLRAAAERPKPNGERLREFGEAGRVTLELHLFAEGPIYDDLETLKLGESLTYLASQLGAGDELVRRALAGKSPRERAAELVRGTRVKPIAERRRLYDGGQAAVDAAQDPMIELARLIDAEARAVRKTIEAADEEKRQAHALIGQVRFAAEGTNAYPDATGTLRLAFGVTKGYEENGRAAPFQTTLAGLYARGAEMKFQPPFDLPERWLKRKNRLNLATPFNFVCTADIIGGNSGSPVVNRAGEFVGIIFDGNIQSLVADLVYTEEQGRAVAVHSASIIEALIKVYEAKPLAEELLGKRKPARQVLRQ
jgi:hypothetical protein